MKTILTLACILAIFSASARKSMTYRIVSDSLDKSLEPGTCLIQGKIHSDKKGLGEVSTINHKTSAKTTKEDTYELLVSDKDSAIYFYALGYQEIVIYNYDFKSQHVVTIDFYPTRTNHHNLQRKPVIYLYPTKEEDITIHLENKGKLTFTYPKYDNDWKVTAHPDGSIISNGRTYPYLFWEGTRNDMSFTTTNQTIEGFMLNSDSTVQFLETQLEAIGLNQTEQTDFITYWGPIFQQKKFAFVQFLLDSKYDEEVAGLSVSPSPKSTKRVYIYLAQLDNNDLPYTIVPQHFNPFIRKGFTLIEWGGSILPITQTVN